MKSLASNYIRFAVKRHKLVVLLAIALLAVSLALASDLSVDSSMQGILPENNEIITAMTIMDEEFGSQDDIIVAVKSGGSRETAISFLDGLAQGISEKGLAKSLIYKIDLGGEIT
jgi:predicted RND superfamily exporter protein